MLDAAHAQALLEGRHADPFALLGPHRAGDGSLVVRAFLPDAKSVRAVAGTSQWPLATIHGGGLFEGAVESEGPYRLRVLWHSGLESLIEDPYRFAASLGDAETQLLQDGQHPRPYLLLGALPCAVDSVDGVRFAVWAPHASRVSVVGDFNRWDGRLHLMRRHPRCGAWEVFLPGLASGERYMFELLDAQGRLLPLKADPYARQAQMRPATASVVAPACTFPAPRQAARVLQSASDPISIYEVHLASWRRGPSAQDRWPQWDQLADELLPYVRDMGFTHLELLPITEHPLDASWGYQTLGLYAPTARHGDAAGLHRFIARAHALGLGVLLDWVPAHFPADAHGLARFDGTALYEYADPREGEHADWGTLIPDFARAPSRNLLLGSALYWLEQFDFDGLRFDAVASMLYRDYSRQPGQWVPNAQGGTENLEAIALLRQCNERIAHLQPQACTVAEESTAFAGVTRSVANGGLGFCLKWNLGWMNDSLRYMRRDPVQRCHHHSELSFGLSYAFSENFVLPLSHDEVVHGKGSLLGKMPGERGQQFANLRACYGFMWGHPGKKLLFMGGEFAQLREWDHDGSLDWHLLSEHGHAGMQHLVRDLNALYRSSPALHSLDCEAAGFEWVNADDAARSILSFLRKGAGGQLMLVVCNFSLQMHDGVRIGVPLPGVWRTRLNTDSAPYGGGDLSKALAATHSEPVVSHGRAQSVLLSLPPLATLFMEWTG